MRLAEKSQSRLVQRSIVLDGGRRGRGYLGKGRGCGDGGWDFKILLAIHFDSDVFR